MLKEKKKTMNNQTALTDQARGYLAYQVNKAYFSTARIDKVSDVMSGMVDYLWLEMIERSR